MSPPLSDACRARIEADFAPGSREEAARLLGQYGGEPHHREPERVRRDLLELAAGDLARLAEYFRMADHDFRDLIVFAEYIPDASKKGPWNLSKRATPWLSLDEDET